MSEDAQLQVVPRYIKYKSSEPEVYIEDFYSKYDAEFWQERDENSDAFSSFKKIT